MRLPRNMRWLTAGLLLANGMFAYLTVVAWKHGELRVHEPDELSIPPLAAPDLSALNSTPIPSVDVATLREHALFHITRTFYRPPAASTEIPIPDYFLTGTMRLATGARVAFVRKRSDQSNRSLHVGDEVDGWRVRAVNVNGVDIDHDASTAQLVGASGQKPALGLIRGGSTGAFNRTLPRVLGNSAIRVTNEPQTLLRAPPGRSLNYTPPPQ